jgi:hypothetical protein
VRYIEIVIDIEEPRTWSGDVSFERGTCHVDNLSVVVDGEEVAPREGEKAAAIEALIEEFIEREGEAYDDRVCAMCDAYEARDAEEDA